jgi:hypothetical protein
MAKKRIINRHHIIYENIEHKQKELVVNITRGEHMILTRLSWHKFISKGFIKALKMWIIQHEDEGEELGTTV